MKTSRLVPLLSALLLLSAAGCGRPSAPPAASSPADLSVSDPADVHAPPAGGNVVEHEAGGYCGNTVTTVRALPRDGRGGWERSFWGGDSVTITDLLRFLDYSGDVCRCPAEYVVDTEFGTDYGLDLTRGFARHDGGQTDLTEEQLETLRRIVAAARGGAAGTEISGAEFCG